jgi:hypothetical protein
MTTASTAGCGWNAADACGSVLRSGNSRLRIQLVDLFPSRCIALWDRQCLARSTAGPGNQLTIPCLSEVCARLSTHCPKSGRLTLFRCPPEASGNIQVNPGMMAETPPSWSMLLRRPPNRHIHSAFDHFDGIAETPLTVRTIIHKPATHAHAHSDPPKCDITTRAGATDFEYPLWLRGDEGHAGRRYR